MMKVLAVFFLSSVSFATPSTGGLSVTCSTQPNEIGDVFEYKFSIAPAPVTGYFLDGNSSAFLKNLNYKFDVRHLGISKISVTPELITLQGEVTSRLEGTVTTNNFVIEQATGQMVHRRTVSVLKSQNVANPEKDLFMAVEGQCTVKSR